MIAVSLEMSDEPNFININVINFIIDIKYNFINT